MDAESSPHGWVYGDLNVIVLSPKLAAITAYLSILIILSTNLAPTTL